MRELPSPTTMRASCWVPTPAIFTTKPPPKRIRAFANHTCATASAQPLSPADSQRVPASTTTSTRRIIVPGKFDAFHLGHRELARVAAEMGAPTLLSFSGMAEALKWTPRAPVVAAIDRDRVLRAWSSVVGKTIAWNVLPFNDIRDQTPEQFIAMLCDDFGAEGIVCGADWRFGKRAAGDVQLLRHIAQRSDFHVRVVDAVDVAGCGVASSTRVRRALAEGDVRLATCLLGRPHRLVGYVGELGRGWVNCCKFVNQVPGDGEYEALIRVIGACAPFHAKVSVKRPGSADPMTPIELLDDPDAVQVRVYEAEHIYCDECEVYLDLLDKV